MATRHYGLACLGGLLASLATLPGQAGATEARPEARPIVIGASTEAVLAVQREGTAAGPLQPVDGEAASRSYHRYLNSFNKPMPEFKETVGSSTNLSGGN